MAYQIGDQIIHRNYGPGTITGIEEKQLGKKLSEYYVVETSQLTLWVPLDATENSIRFPIGTTEFHELLSLLNGAGERLPDHHIARSEVLTNRMKNRTLTDLCNIIHDLTWRSRSQTLTKNDKDFLRRAEDFLLNEWEMVLGTPREVAKRELVKLLQEIPAT
jgi:RNA polymerase-interacting CarD/CdnL/TRCF family regulator